MDTKDIVIIVLIVAIVAVSAVFAGMYIGGSDSDLSNQTVDNTTDTVNNTVDNTTENSTDDSLSNKTESTVQTDMDNFNASGKAISIQKKWNGQDESYMYEAEYTDGNIRQYNLDGDLIGSTYDSDQAKLQQRYGSME